MAEVYIITKTYGNGVDSWDSIVGVYTNKDEADIACLYLNDLPTTKLVDLTHYHLDYCVETHKVIQ